jgi:hypothetical protein
LRLSWVFSSFYSQKKGRQCSQGWMHLVESGGWGAKHDSNKTVCAQATSFVITSTLVGVDALHESLQHIPVPHLISCTNRLEAHALGVCGFALRHPRRRVVLQPRQSRVNSSCRFCRKWKHFADFAPIQQYSMYNDVSASCIPGSNLIFGAFIRPWRESFVRFANTSIAHCLSFSPCPSRYIQVILVPATGYLITRLGVPENCFASHPLLPTTTLRRVASPWDSTRILFHARGWLVEAIYLMASSD